MLPNTILGQGMYHTPFVVVAKKEQNFRADLLHHDLGYFVLPPTYRRKCELRAIPVLDERPRLTKKRRMMYGGWTLLAVVDILPRHY